MHEDVAQRAYDSILRNGGITVNLQGHEPAEGYAYSPYPELERVIPAQAFTPGMMLQYLNDNESALAQPGNFFGGWLDQQSGNVFLDISHVGPPTQDTVDEAAKNNQVAVFDLANFQEIPTGVKRDVKITSGWHSSGWFNKNKGWQPSPPGGQQWITDLYNDVHDFAFEHGVNPYDVASSGGGESRWTMHSDLHRTSSFKQSVWDWEPEPPVFEFPQSKFVTTEDDHAKALAKYQREHPEEWHVPEDWRLSAADPNWLNQWIEQNGPYMQHGTSPNIVPLIERDGLLPHDTEGVGSKYNDELVPRANHVYIRYPNFHIPARSSVDPYIYIDLRKLDPNNLNADEDSFADDVLHYPDEFDHLIPPKPRTEYNKIYDDGEPGPYLHVSDANGTYAHYGEWADKHQLNHPFHLAHSLNTYRTLAHYGRIPPEAFVPHEEVNQWMRDNGRADLANPNGQADSWRYAIPSPVPYQLDAQSMKEPAMTNQSHSYTREATRLKATNWESVKLAGLIESVPSGTRCYFHPYLPAVAQAQVPMCQGCLERYQQALLATNPDMRSQQAQQYLGALSAWELPEGFHLTDPTTPEELAMFSLPGRLKQYEECPNCSAYTTMPLGGCPHCGYEKPVLTTQDHQRAAGFGDFMDSLSDKLDPSYRRHVKQMTATLEAEMSELIERLSLLDPAQRDAVEARIANLKSQIDYLNGRVQWRANPSQPTISPVQDQRPDPQSNDMWDQFWQARTGGLFNRENQGRVPVVGNGYYLIAHHPEGQHIIQVPQLPSAWQRQLLASSPYQSYPKRFTIEPVPDEEAVPYSGWQALN